MELILFCAYLFLFCWIVTRTPFFLKSDIGRNQLVILFLLKIIIGILYGWIGLYDGNLAQMADTWDSHNESLKATKLLLNAPGQYFSSLFYNGGQEAGTVGSLFSSSGSYWNILKTDIYIRLISLFNCFSFGNYYINLIFYSFLTFFGVIAIYRVMRSFLNTPKKILIAGCFLVPSFAYWCSGLHKDGLTFMCISLVIYECYFKLQYRKATWVSYLVIFLSMGFLFILRNHIFMVLLPGLLAWCISFRYPARTVLVYSGVYLICIICFFGLKYIHPSLDFPAFVTEKQEAFNKLVGGSSSIAVQKLEPDFPGFIKLLPQAVSLSMFRPYISDIKKVIVLPAFLELLMMWLLFIWFLVLNRKNIKADAFSLFLTIFSVSVLLMIGYTVNNLGATVRYRAIIFPLITPPLLAGIYSRMPAQLKSYKFL